VEVNLEFGTLVSGVRARFRVCIAVALLFTGCSGRADPILVGIAGPMSEGRGVSARRGAQLAVEEINGAGGIRGRPLALMIKDDSARVEVAVRTARELYEDSRVVALVGHLTNETALATAPIYNAGSRPMVELSVSARSPNMTEAGPFTFGIGPTYTHQGNRLAEWAQTRFGAQRAAIMYRSDDYGRGIRAAFSKTFQAGGGVLVAEHAHTSEIPTVAPFLELLRTRVTTDILVVAFGGAEGQRILSAVDSVQLEVPVLGGSGLSEIEDGAGSLEQIFIASHYLPDREAPANASFVSSFRTAYDGRFPDHWAAAAFDAVHLLAQALGAVGPDRRELRDYLARVGAELPPFAGVTGTIAFDENGAGAGLNVGLGVVLDGRLVTVSSP
jgi:branched-chain amino acid transport system substrate-binding protein